MKTITNITYPAFAAIALACFTFSPMAQAVGPDTGGAIPGANNGEGIGVLVNRTSGLWNTGTGFEALNNLTTGGVNTATGLRALFNTTDGFYNTATGVYSLFNNVDGDSNTADGWQSLVSNTSGSGNVALGARALASNMIGDLNTAIGTYALANSINPNGQNTAVGAYALNRSTGFASTAVGAFALFNTISGSSSAFGFAALYSQTTGVFNNGFGSNALAGNMSGNNNTAMGDLAGFHITGNDNTCLGYNTCGTGDANTVLGAGAGLNITGSGNVCIGQGVSGEAGVHDSTYVRNVNTLTQNFSAGVNNYVTVRLSDGRLGNTAVVSSQRYKEDIKPLDKTSQTLYALKPVSFRLKKKFDPTQTLGFGLIAEEVEQVDPALVYRNEKGQVESVRYEMVNAMLLNEFLKEHRKVEQLEKQVEALTAGLQKVSARLEMSRPTPQTVLNSR
jgi:trimeric autotransporter adhesin